MLLTDAAADRLALADRAERRPFLAILQSSFKRAACVAPRAHADERDAALVGHLGEPGASPGAVLCDALTEPLAGVAQVVLAGMAAGRDWRFEVEQIAVAHHAPQNGRS